MKISFTFSEQVLTIERQPWPDGALGSGGISYQLELADAI